MDGSATLNPPIEAAQPAEPRLSPRDYLDIAMRSPAFYPGVALFLGLSLAFWNLLKVLPEFWMGNDGYYSHGILVPLISGYIVYRRWPQIKDVPIRPSGFALVPLALALALLLPVSSTGILSVMSLLFVLCVSFGTWFVAGWRWAVALLAPTLYLLFALPVWSMAVDSYTNPLQVLSTKVAFQMLRAFGLDPLQMDSTSILVGSYALNVGIPCSGFKLVVALSAFTTMFILIARLRPMANVAMACLVLPIALFMNGLRIAMIGVVGALYGAPAGTKFHDWSGYIMLLLCFFVLFKIARLLGWKD